MRKRTLRQETRSSKEAKEASKLCILVGVEGTWRGKIRDKRN